MTRAQHGKRTGEGQALVEFAVVLPLMVLLIVNVVNFPGFFYFFVTVANASRSAGDYMIKGKVAYSGTGDRSATCASGAGCASTDSTAASAVTERAKFICSGPEGGGVRLIHLKQDRGDFQKFLGARPRRQA